MLNFLTKTKAFLKRVGWVHTAGLFLAGAIAFSAEKGIKIPHATALATLVGILTRLDKLISAE